MTREPKRTREEEGALIGWETVEGIGKCGLEGLSEVASDSKERRNRQRCSLPMETTETKEELWWSWSYPNMPPLSFPPSLPPSFLPHFKGMALLPPGSRKAETIQPCR